MFGWRGSSVVEHWTENPGVGSSILPLSTIMGARQRLVSWGGL